MEWNKIKFPLRGTTVLFPNFQFASLIELVVSTGNLCAVFYLPTVFP